MSKKKISKDMEALSRAIVEAMLRDPTVRAAVNRITESEKLDSGSLMVMTIKMKNLADSLGLELSLPSSEEDSSKEVSRSEVELDDDSILGEIMPETFVKAQEDGRILSKNEEAFRNYASQRFDEKKWLLRNRLLLG